MEKALLADLNEEQKKAVTHSEGPLLIVAGAGTGKTTVIARRIAYLIEQGIARPEEILALTFTDKAAHEMEERVDQLLPYGCVQMQISTFHAFCEEVLREYGAAIGLTPDFQLFDELDSWLLARRHLDRFDLDYYRPLSHPAKYIRALLSHFARAKDEGIDSAQYLVFAEARVAANDALQSDGDAKGEAKSIDELSRAYHTYQQILLEKSALDFGDVLLYTLKLLRERPTVLDDVRKRWPYLLVDEFQDTNRVQYEIVRILAAPANHLTVVGDDDQSIYKFRGASLSNILQFQADYPDAATVVLTQNYRSGQAILDRAYAFIQHNNPHRLETQLEKGLSKKLTACVPHVSCVEHLHAATLEEEVEAVIEKIMELKATDPEATWDDFAILARANDSARPFAAALEKNGIPFHFSALSGLYSKPVILDVLALARVVDNPLESQSLYRVLSHPFFGITPQGVAEVSHTATRKTLSLWQMCEQVRAWRDVSGDDAEKIENVVALISRLRLAVTRKRASEALAHLLKETGLLGWINALPDAKKEEQFRHLQQLLERFRRFDAVAEHPTLREFLREFVQERESGEEGKIAFDPSEGPHMVRVLTVHGAKGLEFSYVFVVCMVDQRFPTRARQDAIPLPEGLSQKPLEENANWHLEEERRLFYVAM